MLLTHLSLTGDGCGLNASTTAVMISVRKTRLVRTKRHFAKFLMFASLVSDSQGNDKKKAWNNISNISLQTSKV